MKNNRTGRVDLSGQSGSAILTVLTFGAAGAILALGVMHGWINLEPTFETFLELYYTAIA